ncbi:uncharacterized protein LOC119369486 [Jatropha curcas]|uniref:uncharacterized protein LOC119369486 n=1 Tax=Jatropha curcas TaxID=180498 RepID=UPI0018950082|nr:uncharacterized protein LOC119369486 [Jatropha curcas]
MILLLGKGFGILIVPFDTTWSNDERTKTINVTPPTNLRVMLDEMLRAQEARLENLLIEQSDTLRNDIANKRENVLGEFRALINISQNGNTPPNQTGGSNDQHAAPLNGDQKVRGLVPKIEATSNATTTSSQTKDDMASPEVKKMMEKMDSFKKFLKSIKKYEDLIDVDSLPLFIEAKLPTKFKMPAIDKFDGTTCRKTHLKIYVGALTTLGVNNELLAHLFQ